MQSQLRLTAQRLGQLQDKLESQGQITRRDVAYLLQQRNIALARAKAQKLIRDDVYGDLLQTLEMLVGVLLEHITELDRRYALAHICWDFDTPCLNLDACNSCLLVRGVVSISISCTPAICLSSLPMRQPRNSHLTCSTVTTQYP